MRGADSTFHDESYSSLAAKGLMHKLLTLHSIDWEMQLQTIPALQKMTYITNTQATESIGLTQNSSQISQLMETATPTFKIPCMLTS